MPYTTQKLDDMVTRFAIKTLLEAGFLLGVSNGGDVPLTRSTDKAKLFDEMRACDESWLRVYEPSITAKDGGAARIATLFFVYGNSGYDAINDNTVFEPDTSKPHRGRFMTAMEVIDAYCAKFDV